MHSTNNLEDGYMGSGKRLRASIRKHGKDNHTKEIIGFFDNRELLVEAEKEVITPDMVTDKNCMNLMGGGNGGYVSEEACIKGGKKGSETFWVKFYSNAKFRGYIRSKYHNYRKGRWCDNEYREKLLKNLDWVGKTHTDETKRKMSESSKGMGVGKTNSQYGTCWITKDGVNKKVKKEALNEYIELGWGKGRKI